MSSRSLTGWLLIAGPILTFLVIGVLYPALVGEQADPQTSVAEMMAKPELARLLLGIGASVFVSIFLGLALLARSIQGDDKPGGAYATVAGIIFVALAAVGIAAVGLSAAALEASTESVVLAVTLEGVSTGMFAGLWFFWGIGSLLLGAAMLMQKHLHIVVAWLYVAFGVYVVISSLVDLNEPDVVSFVVWIVMTLVTAAAGLLTIKGKTSS